MSDDIDTLPRAQRTELLKLLRDNGPLRVAKWWRCGAAVEMRTGDGDEYTLSISGELTEGHGDE